MNFTTARTALPQQVKSAIDGVLSFEEPIGCDIVDTNLLPKKVIKTCESNVSVRFEDAEETYLNVSLNESASSYIAARMQKSELVTVEVGKVPAQPPRRLPQRKRTTRRTRRLRPWPLRQKRPA